MFSVAHLPSTLGNSALTDNQNLVCSDDGGQPFPMNTQLINVRVTDFSKNKTIYIQCKCHLPVSDNNCCPIGTHFSQ